MSVVLITGCSSGIGREAARVFAERGDAVYATMRDVAKAGDLAGTTNVSVLALDVVDGDSVNAAVAEILKRSGRIDVVVNNAGVDAFGAFENVYEDEIRRVMETNFYGALRVTRACLPAMRAQRSGTVVMVTSLGAVIPTPGETAYAASKRALEGAAEVLSYEVARWGIRVCIVQPGFTATDINRKFDLAAMSPRDSEYRELIEFLHRDQTTSLDSGAASRDIAGEIRAAVYECDGFQIPVGEQAKSIVPLRGQVAEKDYFPMVREQLGIRWWVDGEPAPRRG
ncbi:MAG: SDR family oxidoreductase [Deltaproteobacteria bacterium]|nr:SDR family oxidoreductase [Deltaproteobacteria bacterium]